MNEYHNPYSDDWVSGTYEISSTEDSFTSAASHFSSPSEPSLSSSYFSVGSVETSFSDHRRSSIVSPTSSTRSHDQATRPATPQQREKWSSSAPANVSSRPAAGAFLHFEHTSQGFDQEDERLWVSESWHAPIPSSPCPRTPSHGPYGVRSLLICAPDMGDPAFSQQIFGETVYNPIYHYMSPHFGNWSTPRTVAPRATLQSLLPSSPPVMIESSSPCRAESLAQYRHGVDSSPLRVPSPRVVPSHGDLEILDTDSETMDTTVKPTFTRTPHSRSARRQHISKSGKSATSKSRRALNGIVYDEVIPQNTFPCSFAGCVDKSTTKQKTFKRQEHRKRHEKAVHNSEGERKYYCWVPRCNTAFNRTDNLKNHYKTHGKNNSTQRNRYVATLDRSSTYSNPHWQGELTEDGYPHVPDLVVNTCWVPQCTKMFHLTDKLKTHLLQQHGKKSSGPDSVYVATLDESSELFDPDWEGEITEDGLPVR